MLLRRHCLDKAETLLFRNSTMQCSKGNVGCCLFQTNRIGDLRRPAVTTFDILSSALMLDSLPAVQRGLS